MKEQIFIDNALKEKKKYFIFMFNERFFVKWMKMNYLHYTTIVYAKIGFIFLLSSYFNES